MTFDNGQVGGGEKGKSWGDGNQRRLAINGGPNGRARKTLGSLYNKAYLIRYVMRI